MNRTFRGVLLSSMALLLAAIPALAHHTIAAEFDTRDTVTLTGVFTHIDWINPHIYFFIDVKSDDGKMINWAMETYPTGFFHRAGITRDLFKLGDTVTVTLYKPKDGTRSLGYLKEMTLPSGRKIEFDNGRPPSR
jgi:Family of unknown function (DUF6152)